MARCPAIKADGERCRGEAMPGAEWCYSHNPEHADARQRAARKGGNRGGRGRPVSDLAEVKRRLREMVECVMEGTVDRGDAAVAGQLLNTWIRATTAELKAREQQDLEERLEQLEALLHDRDEETRWRA